MYRTKTVDDEKKYKKNEPEKVRFFILCRLVTCAQNRYNESFRKVI